MSSEVQLPDECWERVFRFLVDHRHRYLELEPLSVVSKQFLSITNRLRFSLSIIEPTLPFLPRLFLRFPSLTSLDLTRFRGDLHALLLLISRSPLPLSCLKSLNLSHHKSIPANGLRALSEKIPTLTSLNCSHMGFLTNSDLLLIADCFPFLEDLDISYPKEPNFNNVNNFAAQVSNFGIKALSLALPKLRKVNLSGNFFINDSSLFSLCQNCEFLQEVLISECQFITQYGISSAIRERPGLRSFSVNIARPFIASDLIGSLVSLKTLTCLEFLNSCISDELLCSIADEGLPLRKLVLNNCYRYSYNGIFSLLSKCQFIQHLDLTPVEFLTDQRVAELSMFLSNLISINLSCCWKLTNSAFLALSRNCPLLNEVKMESTNIGIKGIEEEDSLMGCSVVNPHVKSLHLANNPCLSGESITVIASICPNLEVLDLSSCCGISEGVVGVLKRCSKIRNLSLVSCSEVNLSGMDFEVPNLEVLKLSVSRIDDEALSVISKSCPGLINLDLECCSKITAKGVREVVQKCTKLREINLEACYKVDDSVIAWMVFSRPSLRKIKALSYSRLTESLRKLFLRHGCLIY